MSFLLLTLSLVVNSEQMKLKGQLLLMSCEAKQKPAGIAPGSLDSETSKRIRFVIRKKILTGDISVFQSSVYLVGDGIRDVFSEELVMYEVRGD